MKKSGPCRDAAGIAARYAVVAAALFVFGCSTPDNSLSGAVNTGTYPNLNIKPAVATTQISDEEEQAALESIKAAQVAQVRSGQSARTSAKESELKRLGNTHSGETLKAICAPRPTC